MKHDLQANKQNAIDFYRTAYLGDPAGAVAAYVGDKADVAETARIEPFSSRQIPMPSRLPCRPGVEA